MNGKSIVVIGALAAGAYLLLGGSGLFGGAEGGGTKKATAITGVVPGFDGSGSPGNGETPVSGGSTGGSISSPFQPSQYLMDLINQKYNPVDTKKAISVATSQYQYGDQLGSKGSTNAFDVIAASVPQTRTQAFGNVSPAMMAPITASEKSNLASLGAFSQTKKITPTTNLGSWGSGGMSSLTSGGPPAQTPALSALQQKMGVVLKSSSSSSSSSPKKSSSSGGYRYGGSVGGWGV